VLQASSNERGAGLYESSPRSRACACVVRRRAAQNPWDGLHPDDRARSPLPQCLSLYQSVSSPALAPAVIHQAISAAYTGCGV